MRAIFISYRREDVEGHARSLFQDLTAEFGKEKVFMDVAGIEPGRDFRRVIDQQVASCEVLLAMIGKDWLDAKDEAGHRRLDQPADFVRLETASALKRDIPVVPVLVHGAKMPQAEELPEDLKDLAYRNAVELTHARWDSDVQVLMDALRPHVMEGGEAVGSSGSSGGSGGLTQRVAGVSGAPGGPADRVQGDSVATHVPGGPDSSAPPAAPAATAAIATSAPRPGTLKPGPIAIASLLVLVVLVGGYRVYRKVTAVPTVPSLSATQPDASLPVVTPAAADSPAAPSQASAAPSAAGSSPIPAPTLPAEAAAPGDPAASASATPAPAEPIPRRQSNGLRRSGDPTAPAVLSEGQLTVQGTRSVNLDTGNEANNASGADFFWEQRTAVKRFLVPRNGAAFLVLGERNLESVSYAELRRSNLSTQPIDGSEGRENQLPAGTVIAYRTKNGRFGKLRIVQYGYNLVIRRITYVLK